MITLQTAASRCDVDEACGARLATLRLGGHEVLAEVDPGGDPLRGGCYPMAPWAGRIRHGEVTLAGITHIVRGVGSSGAHPLHGTVADRPWTVVARTDTSARCTIELGDRWPVPGTVEHAVTLADDSVTCVLTLTAGEHGFPAQIGWHPWFPAPWARDVEFRARYLRDHEVLPTGDIVGMGPDPLGPEPLDDCFLGPRRPPRLVHPEGTVLEITSDASCWVIYDEPGHAVCIEPQTGPPDAVHLEPWSLPPGGVLRRWMRLGVVSPAPSVTVQ